MISILDSVTELERCHQARALAVECYALAIQNVAHYAIDLEPEITGSHKQYLNAMGAEIAGGESGILMESRATLRGLLRDYHEKANRFLAKLHEELAANARALEEIMESLSEADGDHAARLRTAILRLREVAALPESGALRGVIQSAADTLEKSTEDLRVQHQMMVSQFQEELRVLHKRIDSLENVAAIDALTKLLNRAAMEERIRAMHPDTSLLLIRLNGLRLADLKFGSDVAAELAGAFTKRLRNSLAPAALIGRWGHEEFAAIVPSPRIESVKLAGWIVEHLSGSYACVQKGKTVRPDLQLSVAVVERAVEAPERLIERIASFFVAA